MSSIANEAPGSGTRWAAVFALFLAGIGAAIQFAKVPPALAILAETLELGPIAQGFAVSIVGAVGVVLGVLAGSVVAALGPRRALIAALAAGALFAALGAAAPGAGSFMASRIAEGLSHLVVVIAAPALMIAVADPRDRPIALALWSCFFSVGFSLASAVSPALLVAIGWRGTFFVHAGLLALLAAGILAAVPRDPAPARRIALGDVGTLHIAVYRSGGPMLLALVFCAYTILFLAILTFLNLHFIEYDGFSPAASGAILSVLALFNPLVSLTMGPLVRAGLDPLRGFLASFAAVAIAAAPIFLGLTSPAFSVAAAAILMAGLGALPGLAFALLPRLAADPFAAARATGAIAQFGNVGTFAGPPLLAVFIAVLGWSGGALFVLIACVAGMLLTLALRRAMLNQI